VRILRRAEVVELTGLSGTTLWRLRRRGEFPDPVQLAQQRVGWIEDEVIEWIESRPRVAAGGTDEPAG